MSKSLPQQSDTTIGRCWECRKPLTVESANDPANLCPCCGPHREPA